MVAYLHFVADAVVLWAGQPALRDVPVPRTPERVGSLSKTRYRGGSNNNTADLCMWTDRKSGSMKIDCRKIDREKICRRKLTTEN